MGSNDAPTRIIMWCFPRTISSAFAKCMSGIEGMEIWFEPFCYSGAAASLYKQVTGEDLPMEYEGNQDKFTAACDRLGHIVGCKLEPDRLPYGTVKRKLESTTSKHVFVKDMAFGMIGDLPRRYIPSGYKHVFLIRHPIRTYTSYRKAAYAQLMAIGELKGDSRDVDKFNLEVDDNVLPSSTFYKDLHDLWKYVRENIDPNPVVIDADDLMTSPGETLSKFCEAVGLPYTDSLLKWDASTDVLDTWKATGDGLLIGFINFYGTAMKSSHFMPPTKAIPRDQLPADIVRLADKSMPYYEEILKYKI